MIKYMFIIWVSKIKLVELSKLGLSQMLCKQRRVVENRANIFRAAAAKTVAALSTT